MKIKYTKVDKNTYTTCTHGIEFCVTINGVTATGHWRPSRGQYVSNGVDVNELKVAGRTIRIFENGGTHRTYEIAANLVETEKQPKDLRFTGPRLSVDNLKNVFVEKIKNAIQFPKEEARLSREFVECFGLK